MPYGKRSRRAVKRRRVIRGSRSFVKKVTKVVNRALKSNVEVKRFMGGATEVSCTTLTPGAAGNFVNPLTSIGQGSNSFNRIGNRIKVVGIQLKNFFHNNTTVPIWVRFAMFKLVDRAAIGTTSAIFSGTSNQETDFATVSGMTSMMRPLDRAVCKPLYEKVFKVTANSGEGADAFRRLTKFIKFPRGLIVDYNSSSTGVTATVPMYTFGCWASEAPEDVGAGSVVEWSYQYTVFFTDA